MSTWVLVSHLPPYLGTTDLKNIFNKGKLMNEIRFISVCTDDYGIQSQAFIDFWNSKDAKKASSSVDGSVVTSSDSRAISVAVIWSKHDTLSTVVVDRVPKSMTTQGLFDMFEPYGDIIHASFIANMETHHYKDTSSKISQRRAHVTFRRIEYAIDAANKMNGQILSYECGPNGLSVKLLNADARNLKWKRDSFDYVKWKIPQRLLNESAAVTKRPVSSGGNRSSGGGRRQSRRAHQPPRFEGKQGPRDRTNGHRQRSGGGRRGTQAQPQQQSPSHSASVRRGSVLLKISQTTDAYDPRFCRDRSGSGSASNGDPRFCRDMVSGAVTTEREWRDSAHYTSLMNPKPAAFVVAQEQQQNQLDDEVKMAAMWSKTLKIAAEMEEIEWAKYQAQLKYCLFTAGVAAMTGADTSTGGVSAAVSPMNKSGEDKSRSVSPPAGSVSSSLVASDVERTGYVTQPMNQKPVVTNDLTGPHFIPLSGGSGDCSLYSATMMCGRRESGVGSSLSVTTVSSSNSVCSVSTGCDEMSSVSRRLKPSQTQKKIDEEKRRQKANKHCFEVSASVVYSGATYTPSSTAAISTSHNLTAEEVARQSRVYECRQKKLIAEMLSGMYGCDNALKIASMMMCIPLDERRVIISNEWYFFAKANQFYHLLMNDCCYF